MTKTAKTDGFGASERQIVWGRLQPGEQTQAAPERVIQQCRRRKRLRTNRANFRHHIRAKAEQGVASSVSQYVGMAFDRQNAQAVHVLWHEQQGVSEWKPHLHMPATMPATMPMAPTRYAQVAEHGGVPVRIVL